MSTETVGMSVIDAHHHLWHYSPTEHVWMNERMDVLRRDFLPADLKTEIDAAGVSGVVSVQARQMLDETRQLLAWSAESDWVQGVVGWVPLAAENLAECLDEFSGAEKLKGVRHVVHDEPDDDFILGEAFNRGVGQLAARGLTYDILIFERHLPQTIQFVDRHSQQPFVVDHIAKPRIAAGELEPWRANISQLAERPNVTCKLSGVVTEADWQNWSADRLRPYLDTVLETFGPERLMFGSDWPVCLLATSYGQWLDVVRDWAAPLSEAEREQLFWQTATDFYGL